MTSNDSHPADVHGQFAERQKIEPPSLGAGRSGYIQFVLHPIVDEVAVQPRVDGIYLDMRVDIPTHLQVFIKQSHGWLILEIMILFPSSIQIIFCLIL